MGKKNTEHIFIRLRRQTPKKKRTAGSDNEKGKPESLLIEIGVEELPVAYIEPAAREFEALVCKALDESKIPHGESLYWHTPRRLVVFVKDVHPAAPDRQEEFVGPSLAAGRVISGSGEVKFLPAAVGFASKFGLKPEELLVKKTPRGEYFAASVTIPGIETVELLSSQDKIPSIIKRLRFPKTMVWNSSGFRFARPIRNLLVLYGSKAVVCALDGGTVISNRFKKTFGIGPGFSKKIIIPSADKYKDTLKNNGCVIVDHKERAARLASGLAAAAKRQNAVLVSSETVSSLKGEEGSPRPHKEESLGNKEEQTLFDEVNSLVEYPVCVAGSFDEKYLALPEEILVTCMKKKQKFFALYSDGGAGFSQRDGKEYAPNADGKRKIINKFIAVKNGVSSNLEVIASNYEKVLTARLEDALFFYKNDLNKPVEDLIKKLSGITFHEKLGNMLEKTMRVERLAEKLAVSSYETSAVASPQQESLQDIKRGARLSKFDLATEIVFEYPELSGVAGAIYARAAGENDKVAKIIREHYLPIYSDDEVPSIFESSIVAIADKADTVAADFWVGIIPTGSEDPYGLRRSASGILKILFLKKINLSLNKIFQEALDGVVASVPSDSDDRGKKREETIRLIMDFFAARLEAMALAMSDEKFSVDEVRAALGGGFDYLPDFFARLAALRDIKREKNFESILISVKRAANIIRQAEQSGLKILEDMADADESLFMEDEEKRLYRSIGDVALRFEDLKKEKDYIGALKLLLTLSQPLEDFFNKVMVMCHDEKLRVNRLRLLGKIVSLYSPVADFSKLVKPGERAAE